MAIGLRPLLILTILLIMLGVQFISIGLIGEMVTHSKYVPKEQYIIKVEVERQIITSIMLSANMVGITSHGKCYVSVTLKKS